MSGRSAGLPNKRKGEKPGIIVIVPDDAAEFRWLSVGWLQEGMSPTEQRKGQKLFTKAHLAIQAGKDVPDVIDRLKKAGFSVTRDTTISDLMETLDAQN